MDMEMAVCVCVVAQASVDSFTFDHLFDPETENAVVYEVLVIYRSDLLR